jgi:hypothetical protein
MPSIEKTAILSIILQVCGVLLLSLIQAGLMVYMKTYVVSAASILTVFLVPMLVAIFCNEGKVKQATMSVILVITAISTLSIITDYTGVF